MLMMYETADQDPARKVTFNLVVTGVSIASALTVGVLAFSTLLTETTGIRGGPLAALAAVDTHYAGYLLALLFAVIGLAAVLFWRRSRRPAAD
jgi:high-affinity nickel-transport protein